MKWSHQSLQNKLFLVLVFAIVVPLSVVGWYSIQRLSNSLIRNIQDRYTQAQNDRLIKTNELLLKTKDQLFEFSQNNALLDLINKSLFKNESDIEAINNILNASVARSSELYSSAYFLPAVCFSSQINQSSICGDKSDEKEDIFFGALETISIPSQNLIYIGRVRKSRMNIRDNELTVIPFSLGIRKPSGEIIGVLVIEVILVKLITTSSIDSQNENANGSSTYIINSDGTLLYSDFYGTQEMWGGKRPNDLKIILKEPSGIVMDSKDRPNTIQVFSRIRPRGQSEISWTVLDEIPMGDALREVRLVQELIILLSLVCLSTSLWIFRMITVSIVEPLGRLVEAARRLGNEDYDALLPVNTSTIEVANVASSMLAMREKVRMLLTDLRFASKLLETSQRLSNTGGWEADLGQNKVYWTAQTYRIHGLEPVDVHDGIDLQHAIGFYEPESQATLRTAIVMAMQDDKPFDLTLRLKTVKAESRWVHIVGLVLHSTDGKQKLNGAIQDVTEAVIRQHAIRQSEEMLKRTGQVANIGGWEIDLRRNLGRCSDQTSAIYEIEHQSSLTIESMLFFYSLDIQDLIQKKISYSIKEHSSWDLETKIITAKGNIKWVHIQGSAIYENERAVRLYGSVHDVTKEVLTRHAANQQKKLLQSCLDNMQTGVTIFSESKFIYANTSFRLIVGLTPIESIDEYTIRYLILSSDLDLWNQKIHKVYNGESSHIPILLNLVRKDNSLCRCLANVSQINWNNEQHILASFSPLSESDMVEVEIRNTQEKYDKMLAIQLEKQQAEIAHDLHDTLGTELAGISILLGSYIQNNTIYTGELAVVLEHVKRSATLARNLAHGLMPIDQSPGALWRGLDRLCESYREVGKVDCHLRANGDMDYILPETANHLYRISKEAIVNAVKHGSATKVSINFTQNPDWFSFEIWDNGKSSIDLEDMREGKTTGIGLKSMRARAKLFDASLDFFRNDSGGITVSLKWW